MESDIVNGLRNLSEIMSDLATGRSDNFFMSCAGGLDKKELLAAAKKIAVLNIEFQSALDPDADSASTAVNIAKLDKQARFKTT